MPNKEMLNIHNFTFTKLAKICFTIVNNSYFKIFKLNNDDDKIWTKKMKINKIYSNLKII